MTVHKFELRSLQQNLHYRLDCLLASSYPTCSGGSLLNDPTDLLSKGQNCDEIDGEENSGAPEIQ
jgi:hypothetical protein